MKKLFSALFMSLFAVVTLHAMDYEQAREQALFLTDKMAYELNLNDQQYEDCYEINLDYLLSVQTADDVYGNYLIYRNADLRHILFDWQYSIFATTDYFFHPLLWYRGAWSFPIYRYYTYGHFFYHRPAVYLHIVVDMVDFTSAPASMHRVVLIIGMVASVVTIAAPLLIVAISDAVQVAARLALVVLVASVAETMPITMELVTLASVTRLVTAVPLGVMQVAHMMMPIRSVVLAAITQ